MAKPWELNWAPPSAAAVTDRLPDEPDAEKKPWELDWAPATTPAERERLPDTTDEELFQSLGRQNPFADAGTSTLTRTGSAPTETTLTPPSEGDQLAQQFIATGANVSNKAVRELMGIAPLLEGTGIAPQVAQQWREIADQYLGTTEDDQFVIPPEVITGSGTAGTFARGFGHLAPTVGGITVPQMALRGAGLNTILSSGLAFELQSQSQGGEPGHGALFGVALAGFNKVGAKTVAEKILQKGLESVGFYKAAEASGAPDDEKLFQAMLPLAFESVGLAKRLVLTKPEQAAELGLKQRPSATDFQDAGVTTARRPLKSERQWSADEREAFVEIIRMVGQRESQARLNQAQRRAITERGLTEPYPPGEAAPATLEPPISILSARDQQIIDVLKFGTDLGRVPTKNEVRDRLGVSRESAAGLLNAAYGPDWAVRTKPKEPPREEVQGPPAPEARPEPAQAGSEGVRPADENIIEPFVPEGKIEAPVLKPEAPAVPTDAENAALLRTMGWSTEAIEKMTPERRAELADKKRAFDARTVRSDEGQVSQAGPEPEGRQDARGEDLQQPAPEAPKPAEAVEQATPVKNLREGDLQAGDWIVGPKKKRVRVTDSERSPEGVLRVTYKGRDGKIVTVTGPEAEKLQRWETEFPGLAAAKKKLLDIYEQKKDQIGYDDRVSFEETTDTGDVVSPTWGYSFKGIADGPALAKELRERLPKNLQMRVKVVKEGDPGFNDARGSDVAAEIGIDRMVENMLRYADEGPTGRIRRTLEWIERDPSRVSPEEYRAAVEYKQITAGKETAAKAKEKPAEELNTEELQAGDTFEIAGDEFTARKVTEDEVLIEDGIPATLPRGQTVLIDKGSLKKTERPEVVEDDSFDVEALEAELNQRQGKTAAEPPAPVAERGISNPLKGDPDLKLIDDAKAALAGQNPERMQQVADEIWQLRRRMTDWANETQLADAELKRLNQRDDALVDVSEELFRSIEQPPAPAERAASAVEPPAEPPKNLMGEDIVKKREAGVSGPQTEMFGVGTTDTKGWTRTEGGWLTKEGKFVPDRNLEAEKKLERENQENDQLTFGESGEAGDPGTPSSRDRITVEMDPNAPEIKASAVIDKASKDFDLPIRAGHLRGKMAGVYKVEPDVVRNREHNDLITTAHEIAHAIEARVFGWKKGKPKHFKPWEKELVALGKALYGKSRPEAGYAREGFAEFVRYFTMTSEANTAAPKFYDYFVNTFLPKNPNVADGIMEFRRGATQWRQQGAVNRILSQIDFTGKGPPTPFRERVGRAYRRLQSLFADDLAPLERAERAMTGGQLAEGEQSPYKIARAVTQSASAKAGYWVRHARTDIYGNEVGPGLKQILAPVTGDIKNFLAYAYARRGRELLDRGINPGITKEDANYVLQKFANRPEFETAARQLTEWNNDLLRYLVQSGGLSRDAAQVIMEANTAYIPLKRAFLDQERVAGSPRGFVDLTSPVKRIKGSGREVINPLESMVAYAEQVIATADRARVARSLIQMAESTKGSGKWAEKLPAQLQPVEFSLEKIKKQLENLGVDLTDVDMDTMLTIYNQAPRYRGKDNIVTIWRGGKQEFWELAPDLHRALKGLDYQAWPWWTWPLTFPTKTIRLGATGIRAGFTLITNPIRDYWTTILQSQRGAAIPTHYARALKEVVTRGEPFRIFQRAGGEMSQPLGLDRSYLRSAVNDVLADTAMKRALNVATHPLEALREVLSFTESTPRVAEMIRVLESRGWKPGRPLNPGDLVEGQYAGGEVTVDFRRAGTIGRAYNRIVPFFNPGIQGLSKSGRTIKENPKATVVKAMALLTGPTLALWWLNKDEDWYQELPNWQKYGFWNVRVPGTRQIVRVPRPFEWGYVFAAVPEAIADSVYRKDPREVGRAVQESLEQMLPDVVPGAMMPAIEVAANKDYFRDRPIVSEAEERLVPSQQAKPYTTETARLIGRIFDVSPAKVEHLITGYTGGLGRDVLQTSEGGLRVLGALPKRPDRPPELADIPILGRIFGRESIGPQAETVSRFYDRKQELEQKLATRRKKLGPPLTPAEGQELQRLRGVAEFISEVRRSKIEQNADAKLRVWRRIVTAAKRAMGEQAAPVNAAQ